MGSDIRITGPVLKLLRVFIENPTEEFAGAAISKQTNLASGTLYPILRRLEDAKCLESRWEEIDPQEAGRPRRRLYSITGVGSRCYQRAIADAFGTSKVPAWG